MVHAFTRLKEKGEDWKAGDGEGVPGRGARVGGLMLFNDTWSQQDFLVSCITILFLNLQITDG